MVQILESHAIQDLNKAISDSSDTKQQARGPGTSVGIDSTVRTKHVGNSEDTGAMTTVVVTKGPKGHGVKDTKKEMNIMIVLSKSQSSDTIH